MRAHQPGSTPIDIPETVPNPAYTPAPAPERAPTKVPEKVPEKVISGISPSLNGWWAASSWTSIFFEKPCAPWSGRQRKANPRPHRRSH